MVAWYAGERHPAPGLTTANLDLSARVSGQNVHLRGSLLGRVRRSLAGGTVLYSTLKVVLLPVLGVSYRPWVKGLENVPDDGAVIIASNHQSFVDSVFLPLVVTRKMTFLAKSDYFTDRKSVV